VRPARARRARVLGKSEQLTGFSPSPQRRGGDVRFRPKSEVTNSARLT
jgi:hypothetical protein